MFEGRYLHGRGQMTKLILVVVGGIPFIYLVGHTPVVGYILMIVFTYIMTVGHSPGYITVLLLVISPG